ncbi:hypothetical protein [Streptomyces meridianus]|uniref:Uncharacterized protein n=1 Tax=Streptomyces meridianus TaxID=2938945 RepID=A0ABT0XD66_9ACTN|nr:hypothetical protein [Streptomyces meridianus]MCM2579709.1 hypothetical protein [Streptomyces meridianus]
MSLQAADFFAELCLPFTDSTVVGNTYYATPAADARLRLRIGFTGTIYADTYGGLRVAVVHMDRGEIDSAALNFVDHGTFHRRDEAQNTPRQNFDYGTFNTKRHRPGQPPWEGAVTTGLRDAIEQYTSVWFPGAWKTSTAARATSRSARTLPSPPPARSGGRAP